MKPVMALALACVGCTSSHAPARQAITPEPAAAVAEPAVAPAHTTASKPSIPPRVATATSSALPSAAEVRTLTAATIEHIWGELLAPPAPYGWYRGPWSVEHAGQTWAGEAAVWTERGLDLLGERASCTLAYLPTEASNGACDHAVSCGPNRIETRMQAEISSQVACPSTSDTVELSARLVAMPGKPAEIPGRIELELRRGLPERDVVFSALSQWNGLLPNEEVLAQMLAQRREDGLRFELVRTELEAGAFVVTVRTTIERVTEIDPVRPLDPDALGTEMAWIQELGIWELEWRIEASPEDHDVGEARELRIRRERCQDRIGRRGPPFWPPSGETTPVDSCETLPRARSSRK